MSDLQSVQVGRHRIVLAARQTVGPPTPYTTLLAESIPALSNASVVDIGTGSGFLAIVAALQGASLVQVTDTNPAAIEAAFANAELNGVRDRLAHLPIGESMIPLPAGMTVDVVMSNPAQLPLPQAAEKHNPYYAGPDGRGMIDAVIDATPSRLSPGGRLLMIHNSVTDFPKSSARLEALGLKVRVLGERTIELRPFFDRAWLDHLDGERRGLYHVRDGRAWETFYALEARRP